MRNHSLLCAPVHGHTVMCMLCEVPKAFRSLGWIHPSYLPRTSALVKRLHQADGRMCVEVCLPAALTVRRCLSVSTARDGGYTLLSIPSYTSPDVFQDVLWSNPSTLLSQIMALRKVSTSAQLDPVVTLCCSTNVVWSVGLRLRMWTPLRISWI
jgi:hypothetical protein